MYNLVLVTVLLGPMTHQFAGEIPSRPSLGVSSVVLGTFQTLTDCKAHMGTPTAEDNAFGANPKPVVTQMTYCAGR